MLDFVPNHTGLDHPWVEEYPEYYVGGTEDDLAREPQNYLRLKRQNGELVLAHGRDPYFPGWPDQIPEEIWEGACSIEEPPLCPGGEPARPGPAARTCGGDPTGAH
jgi:hypothetical protein